MTTLVHVLWYECIVQVTRSGNLIFDSIQRTSACTCSGIADSGTGVVVMVVIFMQTCVHCVAALEVPLLLQYSLIGAAAYLASRYHN